MKISINMMSFSNKARNLENQNKEKTYILTSPSASKSLYLEHIKIIPIQDMNPAQVVPLNSFLLAFPVEEKDKYTIELIDKRWDASIVQEKGSRMNVWIVWGLVMC